MLFYLEKDKKCLKKMQQWVAFFHQLQKKNQTLLGVDHTR